MKVAIAGTNGLACWIAHYMQSTYHTCILFSRALQAWGWTVLVVDYSNEQSLVYFLGGIDLVISFVSGTDQLLLIDAALRANVSRFVPAEFGGSPENRTFNPILDNGKWAALNRLGQHVEEGMQHTSIVCGLFYERFAPDGLQVHNIGHVHGANGEGDFLMDVRAMRAQIPNDRSGRAAMVCLTAMEDVAKFIVAALDLPRWPRELRMYGERMSVSDVVRIAEVMRDLRFERREHTTDSLRSSLQLAQSTQDEREQHRVCLLMATANGEFDLNTANLNEMVQVQPTKFRDWLGRAWEGQF